MNEQPKLVRLKISAPGKVILFGEHSVVHNKTAIAATLGLRTKLHFSENDSGLISLNFPSVGIEDTFSVDKAEEFFRFSSEEPWDDYLKSLTENFDRFYTGNKLSASQKTALITFFHCFSNVLPSCRGFDLRVDSDLAVGSGVGSSASFSVVLSTASLICKWLKDKGNYDGYIVRNGDNKISIKDDFRKLISELSLSCEKIIHGTPSGIDHNTILSGSMLEFVKSESGNKMTRIESGTIKILLVNTNVSRSTKAQVEKVKELKSKHGGIIENVLEAMGHVSKSAIEVLKDLKTKPTELNDLETKLSELININHELLRVLGVSHPSLEKMCSIAEKYGLSAKLTGAGGGGNGFVFVFSKTATEVVEDLKEELTQNGFTVTEATLGGPGLIVEELAY